MMLDWWAKLHGARLAADGMGMKQYCDSTKKRRNTHRSATPSACLAGAYPARTRRVTFARVGANLLKLSVFLSLHLVDMLLERG